MPVLKFKPILPLPKHEQDRFWESVRIKKIGCWEWAGGKQSNPGYGYFMLEGSTRKKHNYRLSHRVAYALAYKKDPREMAVCHRCDNPICCRPRHLFLGTKADNNTDRHSKGRSKLPTNRARGTDNARSKLDEQKVRDIRERYASGESSFRIAAHFGIHPSTVVSIAKREWWKHVK